MSLNVGYVHLLIIIVVQMFTTHVVIHWPAPRLLPLLFSYLVACLFEVVITDIYLSCFHECIAYLLLINADLVCQGFIGTCYILRLFLYYLQFNLIYYFHFYYLILMSRNYHSVILILLTMLLTIFLQWTMNQS